MWPPTGGGGLPAPDFPAAIARRSSLPEMSGVGRRQTTTRSGSRPASLRSSVFYRDRKSTRLNSSHQIISYAVFCLKKKKKRNATPARDRVVTPVQCHPDRKLSHES